MYKINQLFRALKSILCREILVGPVLIISLMQCQSMKAISIYIHNAYRFCTLHVCKSICICIL